MCAMVSPPALRGVVMSGEALVCVPSTTISPLSVERPSEGGYLRIGVATRGGARVQWSLVSEYVA
jgi:hypothetical protein